MSLTLIAGPGDDMAVIRVWGDLDIDSAPLLRAHALGELANGVKYLILDLYNVQFSDSVGIATLIILHKKAVQIDGRLLLASIPYRLSRILALTSLDRVFSAHATVAEALHAVSPDFGPALPLSDHAPTGGTKIRPVPSSGASPYGSSATPHSGLLT